LNFYKTIPTFKLLITLLIAFVFSIALFAQRSPAEKNDTASKNDSKARFNKPLFNKSSFLSNEFSEGDSLKKIILSPNQFQDRLSAYNNLFRNITNDVKKKAEAPFSLNDGSLSLLGSSSNINNDSLHRNNYSLLDANISGMLIDIPFSALYQNHSYPFIDGGYQNRLRFQYDKDAYLNSMKKKLSGKFDPEDFLKDVSDPVQMLKAAAEKRLHEELNNIKHKYNNLLDDKLNQLGKLSDLFLKDPKSIRQSLLSSKWIEQLQTVSARLAHLQNQINTGQSINMEEYEILKNQLEKYKGTELIVRAIETNNQKWEQSGLIKRIKESGLIKRDMIEKIKNDPSIIRKLAKQKLDLNGIQRLFLSVTKLNIGQTTGDFSRLLTGNSIMHGINTGFLLNNKKSIDVLAGNLRAFNSILDLPFTNSISNNDNRMIGFRMQKGNQGSNTNSLSLLAFQTFSGNQFPFNAVSLPRKSMVIGFSKQIEINKTNNIQLEVSKSSGYYMNDLSADSSINRHKVNDLLNTHDLLKSIAVTINYNGEFEKIDLQTETSVRYAGINYDNPATSFIAAGTNEFSTGIRKSFLRKKLQVLARSNWRQYKFSETSENVWRNSNQFIDIKWKMKRGQSVSMRYQPVRSIRITDGYKSINGSTERLSITTNLAASIHSLQYRHYFTLAYQKNIYAYQNAANTLNRSLQISSMQSFVIKRNVVYSNTSFNKVNNASAFIFFNTSFNTDLGITYSIGKNLSGSSSFNYNSIEGWYRQIAIRQSLNGELGKKFRMDVYVDIGKNIKTFQQVPFSLFRAEWSLHYMFNR
jgi:hypothetical protein